MNYYGQYGNTLLEANHIAKYRGSGDWNPPPLMEQTTDRGNAFSQAYNVYESNDNTKNANISYAKNPTYQVPMDNQIDVWNGMVKTEGYSVGNTGLHPQLKGSWNAPNIDGVSDRYTEWALRSLQLDPNPLLNFYFSKENVDYLQERLIAEVKRIQKLDISRQSDDELLIIMRNHYTKALSGWLPHEGDPNKPYPRGPTPCSLTERLTRLNKATIEECTKQILSGTYMYLTYYRDASSLPLPMDRPVYASSKGENVLSPNVGFDSSLEFNKAVQSFNQRYNII